MAHRKDVDPGRVITGMQHNTMATPFHNNFGLQSGGTVGTLFVWTDCNSCQACGGKGRPMEVSAWNCTII